MKTTAISHSPTAIQGIIFNRIIAEIFLSDMSRLKNAEYLDVVKNVKESEYKPKILTYELLDDIVGKQRKARRV